MEKYSRVHTNKYILLRFGTDLFFRAFIKWLWVKTF